MKKFLFAAGVVTLLAGCSIRHEVVKDYPQYLLNNPEQSNLAHTQAASQYDMAPGTRAHSYEFRSAMVGYAHLWVVEFGKILSDTLQSNDVQQAFGSMTDANGSKVPGGLLIFDLQNYTFVDKGAHISLKVTYQRDGSDLFSKVYDANGDTQGGKMFWGGPFAMKNAIQQSTKLALDQVLRELIIDLNALPRMGE